MKDLKLKFVSLFLLLAVSGISQNTSSDFYTVEFIKTGTVGIEYRDFGGSESPIIFIQDHHNYFEMADEKEDYLSFLSSFPGHRVIAPVRRGWGKTEDPGSGYDVPTQAKDLLALMDALNIEKAFLAGRTAATQDITWIAENHPERLLGIVYIGLPMVPLQTDDSEVSEFTEMMDWRACDLGNRASELTKPRHRYTPDFFTNSQKSIAVPTLMFYSRNWDTESYMARILKNLKRYANAEWCGNETLKNYIDSILKNPEFYNKLLEKVRDVDPSAITKVAMKRAFVNLKIVEEEDFEGTEQISDLYQNIYVPHMEAFFKNLN